MGNMVLRNRNFSTAFCSHFSHVSHVYIWSHFFTFSKRIFQFFPSAFSKRMFFAFFFCEKTVKKCGKNAFWKCAWKKCEKCVLKMHLEKNVKNMCENVKKWEKMWKNWKNTFEHPVGKVELWFFFGSSFAAVTLLPAQLLQVENRRGAVQIDRKWTVQIADLFNFSIAKQWLPGAKTENLMQRKREQSFNLFDILHFGTAFFHLFLKNLFSPF